MMRRFHYVRVGDLDDALAWVNRSRSVVHYLAGTFDETLHGEGNHSRQPPNCEQYPGHCHMIDLTGKDTRRKRRP